MKTLEHRAAERVRDFVMEKAAATTAVGAARPDPFWKGLRDVGTRLWLDTGDREAAEKLWTPEFSGLTTNNTLLNREIQKGIYDAIVREASRLLEDMDTEQRVIETAFILNALHGQRLVRTFGASVSVELHTATANDAEAAVEYGRRFAAIDPTHFIVKVPLTAAGLIATRALRQEGVPVNFTLAFGARQNHVAAAFAFPSYVNVFLGRLGQFVSENGLGDGVLVGERATMASQREVAAISSRTGRQTLQIAASFRDARQVQAVAGVDVMTIPVATATEARARLSGSWESCVQRTYPVQIAAGVDAAALRLSAAWDVSEREKELAASLEARPPRSAEDLRARAAGLGVRDLFPELSTEERAIIAREGKIPRYKTWAARIASGELAVDSLLNVAGLESFTADQAAMDARVRGLL
ncbi:MAG TPA: transaldolase family protein [Spirochaetia bacterium]|nr:transaldolase family protein [Spirochaetia bacterium]